MQPEDGHSTTLQEFIIDPPVPATSVEVYVVSVYQSYHNGFAEIVAYGNMMSYVIWYWKWRLARPEILWSLFTGLFVVTL